MPARYFLISGFCFSFFLHAVPFFLVAPGAGTDFSDRPATESIFLGAILGEVDVAPPQIWEKPSRRVAISDQERGSSPGRIPDAGRLPDKPFSRLFVEKMKKFPREAPPAASVPSWNCIVFGLSDAGQYFMNIDFSDIIKMVTRDEFSGSVEFEVFVLSTGAIDRLQRVVGSGDPVLDNAIALRLKRAVLRSPWIQEGGRCRLKIILKTPKVLYVPN